MQGDLAGPSAKDVISIFSSFLLGRSGSPVKCLLISCLKGKGLAVSVLEAKWDKRLGNGGSLHMNLPEHLESPRPLVSPSAEGISNVQLKGRSSHQAPLRKERALTTSTAFKQFLYLATSDAPPPQTPLK